MNPPIDDNFRIKIALDTQILAYWIDKTYPNLCLFIKELSQSPFVDIVCSRFAIYEFVGIRKVEHYLRCLVYKTTKNGATPHFSSALKYKNEFNNPEIRYLEVSSEIKEKIEEELKQIDNLLDVDYHTLTFPNRLWEPHQDLLLSTRMSKEDSLLLMSSIFNDEFKEEDYLVLLTNDGQFYRSIQDESGEIFQKHNLTKPKVYSLKEMNIEGTTINLVSDKKEEEIIKDFTTKFILERIKEKNEKLYIGKVKRCPENYKGKLLCFGLEANTLKNNLYLSVLSKNLEYLYNIKVKGGLTNFRYGKGNEIEDYPYSPIENKNDKGEDISRNISVEVKENGDYLSEENYSKISQTGDLVFIHPDTFD